MIREAIQNIVQRKDLTEDRARAVFDEIMSGKAAPSQIAAFITALRMKGETVAEITGAAKVMRKKCAGIRLCGSVAVDTCGTGGSGIDKFNVSTAVAFVVAGSGVKVAKHGNRSASSRCGSADVLEELGVAIHLGPEAVRRCIEMTGIGFMFAPVFHRAMKYAAGPRRELGIRTIFNILGPLSNPAQATSQVLGVYDASLTEVMARVLRNLGLRRAFVVHGADGLDEITVTGKTKITELKGSVITTYAVSPGKFGMPHAALRSIKGGNARENARIIISILKGAKSHRRNMVLLNAAAALIAGFRARNFKEGIVIAKDSIDSGKALKKLRELAAFSKKEGTARQ